MWTVDVVGSVLAMLLPLVLLAVLLVMSWRWRKRRGGPLVNIESRTRALSFVVVCFVIATLVSGALGGWSLESLLIPVGWLVTGLVIAIIALRFRR
jgi:membrane-anchored protein YejM (alkaline phosphatase superfamily)